MFEDFSSAFPRDPDLSVEADPDKGRSHGHTHDLIALRGGSSFERGLYRILREIDVAPWNARIALAFPEFRQRVSCFGFDWLGRAFALDRCRSEGGMPAVLMFEPGTGQALELPCNIISFHDREIIDYPDAALAKNFHRRWLQKSRLAPQFGQCVGYKRPLFLGGQDELDNLELSDVDVYWHLFGQLVAKARRSSNLR